MLRTAALLVGVILVTSTLALAEGATQYARFEFASRAAAFHSAEKTISATEDLRSGELAEMYKAISGKEWTTEKEARGGALEFAFLNALAEQGWAVAQVSYREGEAVYLLKKQK